ncbi:two component transcriptional regulator, LuxR family [Noviherbaspirillum humi]|uniref:Two component transcriptional regulator, LuxR family n=1 Tax=Noviherbaspirillum humi TaxID=1688639 RepID=A0A239G1V0_9BURK|nr:response regulator transcription factor [Noviherbaspirillum humi]SNS62014.1 two component transcriptional regulator, LuxR family [Noviherbaspirillum humi]
MAAKSIKIIIADDHAIVREGLKQILADSRDMAVAGQADNGADAVKLARKTDADVMLLDISMPDKSGIEVLKQVKKEMPKVAVLMLSMHREDQYAIRSLKAGASGYLTKQSAPDQLVEAIRQVASGRKYISPALAQELANQIGEDREVPPHETLSDREFQTLIMIASGKTVSDIAAELSLSVKTISMYRTRLLQKMKLRHNAELTHYAIKNNLVE